MSPRWRGNHVKRINLHENGNAEGRTEIKRNHYPRRQRNEECSAREVAKAGSWAAVTQRLRADTNLLAYVKLEHGQ